MIGLSVSYTQLFSQCTGGYTSVQVNWDKLDYLFNSGGNAPYGNYVTNAMEQTQKFAMGTNYVTLATSASAVINPGTADGVSAENISHTGDITGYTGADVQYNPGANGQTITITFDSPVLNANFTLYDIDRGAIVGVSATDNSSLPLIVTATAQASTILTIVGVTGKTISDLTNTTLGNADNRGTVTINVAGSTMNPVKTITITCSTIGADPAIWLSDIFACYTGSFPSAYNKTGENQPFYGPVTSQPDYFLLTPDNDSIFMIAPLTGKTWFLFADPTRSYTNSLAYDPYNKMLYYISENSSLDANNKTLKRYNFNTEAIEILTTDLTTLGIPTFNSGVESAAASFYNGKLFIGFEGGQYNGTNTRESIVYRLDLNASGVPTNATQVFSINSYSGSGAIHDWADFIIENGILYNYNSRPGTSIISYEHYDMTTGLSTQYLNPNSGSGFAYQSGLTWAGQQYSFSTNTITPYNKNGTIGTPVTITSAQGLTWKNGAGDASENFRPKCDFGDAPASYDPYSTPATQSPAVHERTDSIRLGPTWDREWLKRGVTCNNDVDDGISYTRIMAPGGGGYVVQVAAYNNSGSPATLIAWLDYNDNGLFDASEAITPITVPSSTSSQSFWLYWPSTPNPFVNGDFTYLRVRITAQSAAMTAAHATGYFAKGEVEDYVVLIDNFPLSTRLIDFDAILKNKKTQISWNAIEETGIYAYEIERSTDNINWVKINTVDAKGGSGIINYSIEDTHPPKGSSYYRLRMVENTGMNRFSEIKTILYKEVDLSIVVTPNPATYQATILIESSANAEAVIRITDMQGKVVLIKTKRISRGINPIMIELASNFLNGMYLVRVTVGDHVVDTKLIVKK